MDRNYILNKIAQRQRAVETGDLIANFSLGMDAPITALVGGQPRPTRTRLGELLFRPIQVPKWTFSWTKFGLENWVYKDARRHFRTRFQASDFRVDRDSATLQRYGWSAIADRDELIEADNAQALVGLPLGIRQKYATHARDIVEMSLEYDRATVALASASYSATSPDLDDTIASGSEWNHATNGDARASVRSMALRLAARHALQPTNIEVFLTDASFAAATEDPTFVEARNTGIGIQPAASADELATYWGVGRVTVADSYYTLDGTTLVSMYGDVAILKIMNSLAGFDQREGQLDSFVRFQWAPGSGVAMEPYFDRDRTSWIFPWEAWEGQRTVNTAAAGIIRNTSI